MAFLIFNVQKGLKGSSSLSDLSHGQGNQTEVNGQRIWEWNESGSGVRLEAVETINEILKGKDAQTPFSRIFQAAPKKYDQVSDRW